MLLAIASRSIVTIGTSFCYTALYHSHCARKGQKAVKSYQTAVAAFQYAALAARPLWYTEPMRGKTIAAIICYLLCAALASCGPLADEPAPTETIAPQAPNIQPLSDVLTAAKAQQVIATAGYYYRGGEGPLLVDGLSLSAEAPAPLSSDPAEQLWLGDTPVPPAVAAASNAAVLAQGVLEGPGSYGPGGRFAYRLMGGLLTALTPLDLTPQELLAKAFVYDGQLVRVRGALLLSAQSSLLVERLNAGGIPPADARLIKLAPPFRDEALRARLPGASGAVRYGPVEIEGFWRGGALLPLVIRPG